MKYRKLKTILVVTITIIVLGVAVFGIYKGILYAKEVNNIEVKDDKKIVTDSKNNFGNNKDEKETKKDVTNQNTQTSTNASSSSSSSNISNSTTVTNTTSNNNSQSKTEEKKTNSIVGIYDLIELTDGEDYYNKDQLDALRSYGYEVYLEMRDNSTGIMKVFSDIMEFSYDDKNISDGEDIIPYNFSGNTITFEVDDSKMIFQKR